MATYSRTASIPPLPDLESRQLGSIAVQSFTDALEQLRSNLPRDMTDGSDLRKDIVLGINQSELVTRNGTNITNSGNVPGLLSEQDRKEAKSKLDKMLARQEKRSADLHKEVSEKVDDLLTGLNKWATNPLKGLSDLLDNGVRKLLTGIGVIGSTSLGDAGVAMAGKARAVASPAIVAGKGISAVGKGVNNGIGGAAALLDRIRGGSDNMDMSDADLDGLLTEDVKEGRDAKPVEGDTSRQEKAERQQEEEDERKDRKEQLKATKGIGTEIMKWKVGGIMAMATTAFLAIPILAKPLLDFFANSRNRNNELKAKLVDMPGLIGDHFKDAIMSSLAKVEIAGKPILGGNLKGTDKARLEGLTVIANQNLATEQQRKVLQNNQENLYRDLVKQGFTAEELSGYDFNDKESLKLLRDEVERRGKLGAWSGLHISKGGITNFRSQFDNMDIYLDNERKAQEWLTSDEGQEWQRLREADKYVSHKEEIDAEHERYRKEKFAEYSLEDQAKGKVTEYDVRHRSDSDLYDEKAFEQKYATMASGNGVSVSEMKKDLEGKVKEDNFFQRKAEAAQRAWDADKELLVHLKTSLIGNPRPGSISEAKE